MRELIKNLKFVWKYAKSEKSKIIFMIILSLISIAVSIISPILSAKVIVELTSNNFNRIILIAFVILVVEFISDLIHYGSRKIGLKIQRETLSVLEVDICRNVLRLENNSLDKNGSGVFIKRLTNDTSRIADVFNAVLNMSSRFIKYIGIFIAIFIVSKIVFIYVFIMILILYILEKIRTDRYKEDDKITRVAEERVSGFVGELVRGTRDIKMLNCEDDFINELSYRIDDANYKSLNMRRISWNYKLGIWSIMDICNFILVILLVILMIFLFSPETAVIL